MILKKGKDRFWEIDFLRGFAIILMIFFHIIYDLNFFSITNFRIYSGIILYIARLSASIFVVLAGISLSISYSKSKNWLKTNDIILKFIKRGLKILFLGVIISVITWFYIPRGFVVFGILHFIGTSIILSLIFIRYRVINIIFGLLFIIVGFYLKSLTFDFNILIPLGFIPNNFWTIDYFPLFPWFGIFLIGISIGNIIYPDFKRKYEIKDLSKKLLVKSFCFLGRNSLLIYFLHQPIIIGIITILVT
ncbi:MAG: heparan-alpha-glucosaminide N-acetyltransferase [Candidatus Thermoplasmatota archaeon]